MQLTDLVQCRRTQTHLTSSSNDGGRSRLSASLPPVQNPISVRRQMQDGPLHSSLPGTGETLEPTKQAGATEMRQQQQARRRKHASYQYRKKKRYEQGKRVRSQANGHPKPKQSESSRQRTVLGFDMEGQHPPRIRNAQARNRGQ